MQALYSAIAVNEVDDDDSVVLCLKTGPGDGYLSCVLLLMTLTTDPLGQMSTGGWPKVFPMRLHVK